MAKTITAVNKMAPNPTAAANKEDVRLLSDRDKPGPDEKWLDF